MTTDQSSQWLGFFQRRFALLPDQDDLPVRWHVLVKARAIGGPLSHDARLVAAMQCHSIDRLLTFNGKDFVGLSVAVIDPAKV